jgi:UDP-N-acetylglucosamine 2-epimerase (non-hydrolysing)
MRDCIRAAICGHLVPVPPDLVLVQGDTTSALAGALAAADCGVPLGHVEAGLRSFDLQQPFPEEGNRIAIDRLSNLLFAPTAAAAANLAAEPEIRGKVIVTGNTGIDALFAARDAAGPPPPQKDRKLILVTCHRRENQGAAMIGICRALRRLVSEFPVRVILPLHLNRHVREAMKGALRAVQHIDLIDPVGHHEMVQLMLASWIILTDSGGLQEEGAALGRPVLVLRNVTERGEAAANIELVGTAEAAIVAAVTRLMEEPERHRRMAVPSPAFGDGRAAPRIADAVAAFLLARDTAIRNGTGHGAGVETRQLA